ncbi:hypothetical protein ACIQWR_14710 [Streptomyces sp. NPDC098789]|uniref:hypothetical protein n=1 Tax=Streptomyces sp. NPDC098789 TaxID=3366098 RepID=UPI0038303DE6
MEVLETAGEEAFDHIDHPLLNRQVRDPRSERTGQLMAVLRQFASTVAGRPVHTLTAYIHGTDGLEFTAAPGTLERA